MSELETKGIHSRLIDATDYSVSTTALTKLVSFVLREDSSVARRINCGGSDERIGRKPERFRGRPLLRSAINHIDDTST